MFGSSLWTSRTSEGPGYGERGRAGVEAQAALVPWTTDGQCFFSESKTLQGNLGVIFIYT